MKEDNEVRRHEFLIYDLLLSTLLSGHEVNETLPRLCDAPSGMFRAILEHANKRTCNLCKSALIGKNYILDFKPSATQSDRVEVIKKVLPQSTLSERIGTFLVEIHKACYPFDDNVVYMMCVHNKYLQDTVVAEMVCRHFMSKGLYCYVHMFSEYMLWNNTRMQAIADRYAECSDCDEELTMFLSPAATKATSSMYTTRYEDGELCIKNSGALHHVLKLSICKEDGACLALDTDDKNTVHDTYHSTSLASTKDVYYHTSSGNDLLEWNRLLAIALTCPSSIINLLCSGFPFRRRCIRTDEVIKPTDDILDKQELLILAYPPFVSTIPETFYLDDIRKRNSPDSFIVKMMDLGTKTKFGNSVSKATRNKLANLNK